MDIIKKVDPDYKGKGKRPWIIFYKGEWLSVYGLIVHPDFKDLKLKHRLVRERLYKGAKTMEALMKPKQHHSGKNSFESELRQGVSDEIWEAMKSGSNKLFLEAVG